MTSLIRQAVPADADLVFSLVRELADYERLSHEVDATAEMIASALFGPNPRVFCDIAEWNGEGVGFALWFYNFSTFRGRHGIYLEDLFVRPSVRGHGLGKLLLASLAKRCVAENLARLEWSVLDWNEPSIAFYKAQGAVLLDGWTTCRVTGEALWRLADKAVAP
ncbi:GNAT family N-acetyltransferase [uncultured Alsobacter sp.]|uniref:GNAT family N-acetyltransferase n=1 Tax=uncultured Alsobacter sp. TaxID=1748258 RepID=UPI0025F0B6C1|nr:GNAT family N-acetyltransferase [uncultured Alsobacter sp.]